MAAVPAKGVAGAVWLAGDTVGFPGDSVPEPLAGALPLHPAKAARPGPRQGPAPAPGDRGALTRADRDHRDPRGVLGRRTACAAGGTGGASGQRAGRDRAGRSAGGMQGLLLALLNRLAADTACRVGGTLGVLAFHLGIRRRVGSEQPTSCLGLRGPARARVLRRSYASMGAQFLQVWTIGGPDGPERQARVLNPGWTALMARRHPSAVFLTAHLGDWEMAAHAVTRYFSEVLVYAKAQHNPQMDEALNRRRAIAGLRVVLVSPRDRSGAVLALKALRRGAALGIMADQRPGDGTAAWFLNRPAWCFDGPAFFARKAGVPIIPGYAIRERAGRSALFIGRPFLASGDHAADVQRCMDAITALVAAHPGQYFWQHRRFAGPQPELPSRTIADLSR